MLTLVRQELHQLGFTDDQIDGGGLRVTTTFTRQAMAAAAAGVKQVRPEHQRPAAPHRRWPRSSPAPAPWSGFYGGQNYLRSQINWAEAGGMVGLDLQAGLAGGRDHRRLLAEEHLGRQLAVLLPRRPRGPQRGAGARHQLRLGRVVDLRARAVDQHGVRRHVRTA